MYTILKKEIGQFFGTLIGYMTIGVFLLITGLFLWIFPETNILDYGYATLESLFYMAPWFFMFLIPAITMRSFSEEFRTGTIEILATRPLTDYAIILGKYFATFLLVLFSILPTLIYYYTVYHLASPAGNMDTGAALGSYIGLIMLSAGFVAIGIFSSALTDNQIVAFIVGVFLCFFCYTGFDYISKLPVFVGSLDSFIMALGINDHYNSISRGVLDTRDVVYFVSFVVVFLLLTKTILQSRKW